MNTTFILNAEWIDWLDANQPGHGLVVGDSVVIYISPTAATVTAGPGPRPGDKNNPKP